jgi:hypothetical protein
MATKVLAYYYLGWNEGETAQRRKPRGRNGGGLGRGASAASGLCASAGWAICLCRIPRMQENKKMLKMKVAPNNLLKKNGRKATQYPLANDSLKTNGLSENASQFMKTNQIS